MRSASKTSQTKDRRQALTCGFEELTKGRYIIGEPDEVVEQLRRYSGLGFSYLAASVQSLEVSDEAASAYACWRRRVTPRLA